MKPSLQQLKTDLEIYQEGVAEAPNAQVRDQYRKLCKETYQKIQEFVIPPSRNYRPVVGSLLKKLQVSGFTLVSVDNGDGEVELTGTDRDKRQQAKSEICAVDESHLYVDTSEGTRKWIFIVLGNEPEETVCDHSGSGLDDILEEFSNQWAGKSCPTK